MTILDKLNKFAKNIEDKTGDAIEITKYNANIASLERDYNDDLKKIGEFYYKFYINGGPIAAEILPVLESAKGHQDTIANLRAEIEKINEENRLKKEATKAEKLAAQEKVVEEVKEAVVEPLTNCPNCGQELVPGTKFCGECGYRLEG